MQSNLVENTSNSPEPVLRVFQGNPAHDAVNFVTFIKQELSQIGAVLASDSSDECLSYQITPPSPRNLNIGEPIPSPLI